MSLLLIINKLTIIKKSIRTKMSKKISFKGHLQWSLILKLSYYTRMLWGILKRSWRQHPTKQQLYGYLPPITKTIQIRQTRHAGHCWRSRDELINDVLLRTPSHGQAKARRPARIYIQQLCEDTGCSPEDLPKAMNDADGTTRWWWWW